ncbi:MAG: ribonucleoside-diphosphate reductase subunit alpha, partial [Candidatus Falkowbacteria bacterium]|nr:ribonucleoside-diphosphate reductase subunit alpha [Candidatus Falkowbacteria bacterium]
SASRFISETLENGEAIIRYKAGDTVVCNLASINIARVHSNEDINNTIAIAMRVLDNVITLNFYPIKEAELTAMKYRSVGLGFMGLAEHLACNKLAYDTLEAREYVDGLFEKYAFSVLKHSNALAIERGAYSVFKGSAWEKGEFFGRNKDWFANNSKTDLPWQELFASIQKHGVRFAYHMAPAPNTSTAGVTGTTAGVLPIYKKFFVETNVFSPTINVAPNLNASNFWYYKEYINMDMKDVIDMIAVLYKWIDQSISFEWLLNPVKTSPAELYEWYMRAWKANIKTIYYLRSMSAEVADDCISCSG